MRGEFVPKIISQEKLELAFKLPIAAVLAVWEAQEACEQIEAALHRVGTIEPGK